MVLDLKLIEYDKALEVQKGLFNGVRNGTVNSAIVFCRHYPVITLGRQAKSVNIKADQAELARRGITVRQSERGGDVTYHGPGQLVVYPVVHLELFNKDIHYFLRTLEENVIALLSSFGINAAARKGLTGVWVGEQKICSIGITVKNWISYHGLAINVSANDLKNFSLIRPCGMDIKMTSMETILKKEVSFSEVQKHFIKEYKYA
ncbi:MAG: lipoyl(octanoyl) transferase LipB [Candidatus Omnitrophica bacterium]|nr:lipoyl(octanoyl) transferase LipB [Candidatus Omnitrophota bacterium]